MSAQATLWGEATALHESEAPAVREATAGAAALSDVELLALVLGGEPAKAMARARHLLAQAGSLAGVAALAGSGALQAIAGGKVGQVRAAFEIGRRLAICAMPARVPANRPEVVAEMFRGDATTLDVEKFWVLCLDRKNKVLKRVEISSGTATAALAHPREVFRAAIQAGACAIICVHNHPSGDPAPSAGDLQVTRLLRDAARTVDIILQDHVIVGRAADDPAGRGYFSFREAGTL